MLLFLTSGHFKNNVFMTLEKWQCTRGRRGHYKTMKCQHRNSSGLFGKVQKNLFEISKCFYFHNYHMLNFKYAKCMKLLSNNLRCWLDGIKYLFCRQYIYGYFLISYDLIMFSSNLNRKMVNI